MDFTSTEERQAAAEAARAVFSDVAPDRAPSHALTPGAVAQDIDRHLWHELARTDLLGLTLSPDHGGAGLDPIALCLVLRESARVLARVPLLESCAAAMAVQRYGDRTLAAELLPRAGRGQLILTVGANGRSGHDPAELAVSARPYGEGDGERPGPELRLGARRGPGRGSVGPGGRLDHRPRAHRRGPPGAGPRAPCPRRRHLGGPGSPPAVNAWPRSGSTPCAWKRAS